MKSITPLIYCGLYAGLLSSVARAEPSDAYVPPPVHHFDETQVALASFAAQRYDSYDTRSLLAAGTFQEQFRSPTYSVADLGTVVITFSHTVDPSIGRVNFDFREQNVGRTDELEMRINKPDGALIVCHDYGLDGWRLPQYHVRDAIIGKAVLDARVTLNSPAGNELASQCDRMGKEVIAAFKERRYTVVSGGT